MIDVAKILLFNFKIKSNYNPNSKERSVMRKKGNADDADFNG